MRPVSFNLVRRRRRRRRILLFFFLYFNLSALLNLNRDLTDCHLILEFLLGVSGLGAYSTQDLSLVVHQLAIPIGIPLAGSQNNRIRGHHYQERNKFEKEFTLRAVITISV